MRRTPLMVTSSIDLYFPTGKPVRHKHILGAWLRRVGLPVPTPASLFQSGPLGWDATVTTTEKDFDDKSTEICPGNTQNNFSYIAQQRNTNWSTMSGTVFAKMKIQINLR